MKNRSQWCSMPVLSWRDNSLEERLNIRPKSGSAQRHCKPKVQVTKITGNEATTPHFLVASRMRSWGNRRVCPFKYILPMLAGEGICRGRRRRRDIPENLVACHTSMLLVILVDVCITVVSFAFVRLGHALAGTGEANYVLLVSEMNVDSE